MGKGSLQMPHIFAALRLILDARKTMRYLILSALWRMQKEKE
jgi:hypothetical protein